MDKIVILHDRSRAITDWKCERKRYYEYEYGGRGIVPDNTALELYMGTAIHDGLAGIAYQHSHGVVDIDTLATAGRQQMAQALLIDLNGEVEAEATQFANEQAALVEGLLRGFYKFVWPKLMAQYPIIVAVEQEMIYKHDNMIFMSRPDLVVKDNEGSCFYIEYKSTSSKREEWVNSWNTAVQVHSSIRAIEATTGEKVTGVVIQGLYKGFQSYGKQSSPFCYAYHKGGTPPFSSSETIYEYRSGFKRIPTWELDGGVKTWVEGMPENVLAEQFPQTPPIFVRDDLVDSFFKQRAGREQEIELANELLKMVEDEEDKTALLNSAYNQNFEQCQPSFGHGCPYRMLCHGGVDKPLEHGFAWRVPNHQMEKELLGAQ
jgi:hypothetical protein